MDRETRKEIYNSVMQEMAKIVERSILESDSGQEDAYVMVASDYFDEDKNAWAIDAWNSPDDDAEGTTVAYVDDKTYEIIYMSEEAEESKLVNEEIRELIKRLKERND
jgi:hypothetical protein